MLPTELLKKIRSIEIRTRHIVTDVLAGQYHSAFKGMGMEFEEVREYFPGDDVRAIDWNVTARMQQPFIKKFREERQLTVYLVVDLSASHRFGSDTPLKSDATAELAAILAMAAIRNQDNVALILHTDVVECYIPPGKGPRHVLRVVREILSAEPKSPKTDLKEPLTFLNRIAHRKSVVFLIGDLLVTERNLHENMAVTARRHDLVALRLRDPREFKLEAAGLLDWIDPETGALVTVDTSNAMVRKRFEHLQRTRLEEQDAEFSKYGIDCLSLSTQEEVSQKLARFFRMRVHQRSLR